MEKVDLLVWDAMGVSAAADLAERASELGIRELAVSTPADVERPPLLMGGGPELQAFVQVWVDSVDVWPDLVAQVPGDAYLVTESVPQPIVDPDLLVHLTWFPKPERLSEEEFFHGWHVRHTPTSAELHPLRQGYVRDAVARTLTPGSPDVRAIVTEYFHEPDYLDPERLFGSKEALERTMAELPSYADGDDVNCCPMRMTFRS